MPQDDYITKAYSALKDNLQGFDKSPEQFRSLLSDSAYRSKVYAALKDNIMGFDKTPETFDSLVGFQKKSQSKNGLSNGAETNGKGLSKPSETLSPDFGLASPRELQLGQMSKADQTLNKSVEETVMSNEEKIHHEEVAAKKKAEKIKIEKATPIAIETTAKNSLKRKGLNPNNKALLNKEAGKYAAQLAQGDAEVGFDKEGNPGLYSKSGFFDNFDKSMMGTINATKEGREFRKMSRPERILFANKKMNEQPEATEYIGDKPTTLGSAGQWGGGVTPSVALFGASMAAGGVIEIAAPVTGGLSNLALKPIMSFAVNAGMGADNAGMRHTLGRYYQNKHNGMDDETAMAKAEEGEDVDRLAGIAETALFSQVGGAALKTGKSVTGNLIKGIAKAGIKGGSQVASVEGVRSLAQGEGVESSIKNSINAFEEAAPSLGILHGVVSVVSGIAKAPKIIKNALKYDAVTKMSKEEVDGALDLSVQNGELSENLANKVKQELHKFRQALEKVPDGLDAKTEASVAGLILKRDNIKKSVENKDEVTKELVGEEIKSDNAQIKEILRTGKPEEHEINELTGETYKQPTFDEVQKGRVEDLADKISKGKRIEDAELIQAEANFPEELTKQLERLSKKEAPKEDEVQSDAYKNIQKYLKKNEKETAELPDTKEKAGTTDESVSETLQQPEIKKEGSVVDNPALGSVEGTAKGVNPNGGKWEEVIKNEDDGQGGNIKITRFKTTRINKNGEEVDGQDGTRAGLGGREISWNDFKKEFKLAQDDINDLFGGKEPKTVTIHETRENEASGKNGIDATFHFEKEKGEQLNDNKRFNFNYEKSESILGKEQTQGEAAPSTVKDNTETERKENYDRWKDSKPIGGEEKVKVYRTVKADNESTEIKAGDWVSANIDYIKGYGDKTDRIIEAELPAKHLVDAQTGELPLDTLIYVPEKFNEKKPTVKDKGSGVVDEMSDDEVKDAIDNIGYSIAGTNLFYKKAQQLYHKEVMTWEQMDALPLSEKPKAQKEFEKWTEKNKRNILAEALQDKDVAELEKAAKITKDLGWDYSHNLFTKTAEELKAKPTSPKDNTLIDKKNEKEQNKETGTGGQDEGIGKGTVDKASNTENKPKLRLSKLEGAKENLANDTRTFLGQLSEYPENYIGFETVESGTNIGGITKGGKASLQDLGSGVEFKFYNESTKTTSKYFVRGDADKMITAVEKHLDEVRKNKPTLIDKEGKEIENETTETKTQETETPKEPETSKGSSEESKIAYSRSHSFREYKEVFPEETVDDYNRTRVKGKGTITPEQKLMAKELEEKRRKLFDDKVDSAADKLIKKLTPKSTKGTTKLGLGMDELIRGAAKIVKAAHHAGEDIKVAIEKAIQHIRKGWDKAWGEFNEKEFRDIFGVHNEAADKFKSLKPEDAITNLRQSNVLTQKALRAKKSNVFRRLYKGYVKHIEDISGNAKEALRNAGGEDAVMMKDISSKSGGKASLKIDENDTKIFKGLKEDEVADLGNIIQAKRTIQLDEIYDKREVERLKHKLGYTKEFYEKALEGMRAENPERFDMLSKRADEYFKAQQELLDLKKENGLISNELYEYLKEQSLYSPRVFIEHLDDMAAGFNGGKKISASDNGIKALGEGSEGLMLEDPRLLLAMSTNKAFWIMGKNDAAKSLLKFAEDNPSNGVVKERPIVGETKDGAPIYADVPNGMEVIHAMVDGDKKDMLVSKEFANDWVAADPAIAPGLAEAAQWLTLSAPLRYAATGVNPLFALTNVPRDLAYIYFTTSGTYSKHLPVAFAQIHSDMLKVLPDVWSRKGKYKEFINEGGSIELLTHQGRFYTGKGINEGINKVSHILGWVGETSELLTRMAMRERGITNRTETFVKENKRQPNAEELKKIKIESTYDAINQLDFSQGGDWAKALNKFVPYFNAANQGMRGFARNIRQNPKEFAYKAAQLMAVAGGLVAYNSAQQGWNDVDPKEKAKFYIIMLGGLYDVDSKGRKRYKYIKIPKSQETQFVSSISENAVDYTMNGTKPDKSIVESIKNQSPPIPFATSNPPIVDFIQAYNANYDSYFDERIWKGKENIPEAQKVYESTPFAYRKAGELLDKSPAQLQRATQKVLPIDKNPFITIPGKGFGLVLEGMGVKERDELNKSFVVHMKGVFGGVYKKYVGETFPKEQESGGASSSPQTYEQQRKKDERVKNKQLKMQINR